MAGERKQEHRWSTGWRAPQCDYEWRCACGKRGEGFATVLQAMDAAVAHAAAAHREEARHGG